MELTDLTAGLRIAESTADMGMDIHDVRYNSKAVTPGDIFVAIAGFETDGHAYMEAAAEAGALVVVCEKKPKANIPYVLVENSRHALAVISANFFGNPSRDIKIVGVTGTNGKTTTAFLLKEVIETCTGAKAGLIGTNQNMIGEKVVDTQRTTPESYDLQKLFREMADAGCKYVVMEVSSHALVLNRVDGVGFDVGIFTNLSQDHLDFHKDMDEYAEAKALLFKQCETGIVNLDDSYAAAILPGAACRVYTFGTEQVEADFLARGIKMDANSVRFSVLTTGGLQKVHLKIPGKFSVYNGLAAVAAACALGIPLEDAAASLSSAGGVTGRVEVVYSGDYTVLIDYAHTPDALENVLNTVKGFASGRTVALFGCGGDRDKKKRPLMGEIAARLADFIIVTSDNPRTEEPGRIIEDILVGMRSTKTPYTVIEDRREAIVYAIQNAKKDDVIVLAGKGHETYQIVGRTKRHMDEREIVADALTAGRRE